jgi:hypothetical protein
MVKTDNRDAKELAAALRAQTLEFVRIPSCEEEEVRGLVRCREDIARQLRSFKQIVFYGVRSIVQTSFCRWIPDTVKARPRFPALHGVHVIK